MEANELSILERVGLKYDSLDLAIVRALQKNGRKSFANIARELTVSPGIVQARFAKMKKAGLIVGSTVIMNPSRIGIMRAASVGIEVNENYLEEVKRYIESLEVEDAVIDVWLAFGRYNISMAVWLRNFDKIFEIKQMITRHPAVVNVDISLTKDFSVSYEKIDINECTE